MTMQRVCAVAFFALLGVALASGTRTLGSKAVAFSSSSSGSSSGTDVKRVLAKAFANAKAEGANADSIAQAAAREVGTLFAQAWAKAAGSVRVTGNGKAISEASASARAQANIFAKAIAGAVADAVNGNNDASIAVDATEVATAIVEATASVDIQLTTTGGFAQATSESTATVVAEVVVEAISEAIAFTVDDAANAGGNAKAIITVDPKKQEVTGGSNVKVGGNSSGNANANANTIADALPGCGGEAFMCCRLDSFCDDFTKANTGSFKTVQNKTSGESCKC